MRYAAVTLLFAALTCSAARAQSINQESRPAPSQPKGQGPEVYEVEPQPDSPLRLSVKTYWLAVKMKGTWTEPNGYEKAAFVENVSDRDVTAYAVRETPPGRCSLWLTSPDIIQPGKSDAKSTWSSFSPSSPVVDYEVDFVEFADGTTWGADVCHSAERLAGERAGGGTTAERLSQLLAEGGPEAVTSAVALKEELAGRGPEAVTKAVEERLSDVTPPPEHSQAWEEGFRTGKMVIAGRVRRAVELYGPEGIEQELSRPYTRKLR